MPAITDSGQQAVADRQERELALKLARAARLANEIDWNNDCKKDPLHWLLKYTKTRDDHWKEKGTEPYAPFPDKPYFPYLFHLLQTERRLFLPKSREMGLSWAVIGFAVHQCQWYENTQVIVQSEQAKKAIELVSGKDLPGYARTLYDQQDAFLRRTHPLTKASDDMPGERLSWRNGSSITAVPGGADQVRAYHPAIFIMDEAAFMVEGKASYDTAEPVTSQIIVVSSAGPSWMGDICQRIMDQG
jgi:hypothetical protein